MADDAELKIVDNRAAGRYDVFLDGRPAAFSTYELEPGRIVVTHTVVKPQFEGRGIGSRLAKFVVNDAVSRGLRIKPVCPFTRAYLERHPEYDSIVDNPEEKQGSGI